MNNLLSYCGLVDARISASDKDLPVSSHKNFHCEFERKIFKKVFQSTFVTQSSERLNYHLYQALHKAFFKPGAIFKQFLLPLLESGSCG